MGLDIYFYRVKANQVVDDNVDNVYKKINKDAKKAFSRRVTKWLKILKDARKSADENNDPNAYYVAYKLVTANMLKHPFFRAYSFYTDKFNGKVLTIDEFEEAINYHRKHFCAVEDAYFRKVNFIYEYFNDIIDHDNEMCLTDKEDIINLIAICNEVIKDNDKASLLLPTRSGFFFGSTDYDDWYYSDVKDCKTQMKALLKKVKEGDKILVYFSW